MQSFFSKFFPQRNIWSQHTKVIREGYSQTFSLNEYFLLLEQFGKECWECYNLYLIYGKHVYAWGFVRWGRLAKEIQNYEKEYVDFLLLSDGRHVLEVSYTTTIRCLEEDKVWSTISSLVVSPISHKRWSMDLFS